MKPYLDYEKLLRVPFVEPETGFDISPDGSLAAFSWNKSGRWEIYLLELQDDLPPRRLTAGDGAKLQPRFSPDGKYLLYLLDINGGENYDICLCDLKSGKHSNLMPDTPETIQPKLSWAPDGDWLAFISNRSGKFSTYIQRLDRTNGKLLGDARLVLDEGGPHENVSWSPDGRHLAVVSESHSQEYAAHIVPLQEDGERASEKAIQLEQNGDLMNVHWVDWSPSGDQLVFSGDVEGYYQLGIYDLSAGAITWMTSGKGEKREPEWAPDGSKIGYILSDGPDTWLAIRRIGAAEPDLMQVEAGQHYSPHFTPDGESVLFLFESPRRPDDLWQLDLEQYSLRQLTHSLPEDITPDDFVVPTHVSYPSCDGAEVPALLYQPPAEALPAEGLPPAVIIIHGGPNWLFPYLWYPIMAHMASRGWVVLAPNYRGSTGYGRAWQRANRFEIGRGDTMDVASGVDYLVNNGLADAMRIAVTGRSHGGYLTMSCLTEYPGRWAAGSAIVPFLNWFTSHAASRSDLQHFDRETMGDPIENAELWRERSPFFFLDRVDAPVQLIGGANDPRCPASEAQAAWDALLKLGKEVDFAIYPDEGHTFLKIENIVEHELRRVKFLSDALEG